MSSGYKNSGAAALSKVPLGNLKPKASSKFQDGSDDHAIVIARLERLASQQTDEIVDLRRQLIEYKSKNAELENQIDEMTDFLSDYGLHWVGGPAPQDMTFENGPTDMVMFQRRINELNQIAEQTKVSIKSEKGVARLNRAKPVTIYLFGDGFKIDSGEFRSYTLPMSASFFRDISDGFFPSEFKNAYPDGVVLNFEDKRLNNFQGNGRRLIESVRSSRDDSRVKPTDLGNGEGTLKLRVPGKGDLSLKTEPDTKFRQVRRIVEAHISNEDFEICDPLNGSPIDDDTTIQAAGVYPKGILSVIIGYKKT